MNKITQILILCYYVLQVTSLEVLHQWNFLDFDFPPTYDRNIYRPENSPFVGLEVTDDRIFIGIPRLRDGVGPTFATIPKNSPGSNPRLQAYPDWSFHGAASGDYNCSGLISVYRARLDSCNRLWVLDAGTVSSLGNYSRPCAPKLLVFDIKTDQVVRSVIFPPEVQRPISVFTNLVIDETVQGKCDSAFVYISDSVAPGIVVFDGLNGRTWRFSDPSMFPNPDFSSIRITEDQFALMDGIIGLAHSPQLATLFYQALATDRIFSIPVATLVKGPPAEFEQLPVSVAGRKASQGLPLAANLYDNTLYFSPLTETSIASWNPTNNHQEVLATDQTNLQFVADILWKPDGTIYILSSRFHKFFLRTVTPREVNLRIMKISPVTNSVYPRFNDLNSYYFH